MNPVKKGGGGGGREREIGIDKDTGRGGKKGINMWEE